MNKDELLKIYSAYLPYRLQCYNEVHGIQTMECWSSFSPVKTGNYVHLQGMINQTSKPILYDLSYLTKEIEHKGKMIIPMNYFIFKSTQEAFEGLPEFNEHLVNYIKYDDVKQLLEWHFNVFGLSESEYINKATLTTNK